MDKDFYIKDNILMKYNGKNKVVKIPENVTSIYDNAFKGNVYIKEVILNENMKCIGDSTFSNCINLEKINLENIEYIKKSAFINCDSLKSVTLNKITKIESYAFSFCNELIRIEINGNIEILPSYLCNECCKLKSVKLNDKIYEIKEKVFKNCYELTDINLKNIKIFGQNAFENCKNLKNINFTNTKRIKYGAFINVAISKLDLINLEEIGDYAFKNCKNLKEVNIEYDKMPQKMINIFGSKNSIKKMKLKTKCEFDVMNYGIMPELEKIEIENPLYKIKDGMIYSVNEKELIYCPPKLNIKEYIIPDNVETIKSYCFSANKLNKITINKNIKNIERCAFLYSNIDTLILNIENNLNREVFAKSFIKKIDMSNSKIKTINFLEARIIAKDGLFNYHEICTNNLIIPKKIEEINTYGIDNIDFSKFVKINQSKDKFSKTIQNFIEENNIENINKTLDELIIEGKTFIEASKIIKNYER